MKRRTTITWFALCMCVTLAAQTDSALFAAYQREDMRMWKEAIERKTQSAELNTQTLLYEYGYCGYIVAEAKKEGKESLMPEAKRCVQQFKAHVEALRAQLPVGHYEMYLSAVYVFELRLHESIHPFKSMSLAKDATKLAPDDPLVLSYYGTCLFYAPKPFGDKVEALKWFEKAQKRFTGARWRYCWVREANEMYIRQCHDKLGR